MLNINFYLKSTKPDKNGELPIIAQINFDYKKYRKDIERTKKKYWHVKRHRVNPPLPTEKYNRYNEINALIDQQQKAAKDFFYECRMNNIQIDGDMIRAFLDGKDVLKKKTPKFFEAFNEFIEIKKIDKAKSTFTGYTTVLHFLLEFQKEMEYTITWSNIDITFFDKLKIYAYSYKDISKNYLAKIIATLKTFMRWSLEREYTTNLKFQSFKAPEEPKDVIFLSMDELKSLAQFDFKNERLSKARDVFCFGCFTGLRISDIRQLRHEHIIAGEIIKPIQKTTKTDRIQINKFAMDILDRYQDNPVKALPKLSDPKLNEYIKECCNKAGINTPVTFNKFKGGKVIEVTKPKYQLITSHTARKTFITNSLEMGMNIKTIMEITGHKKDSTFNKYIKITKKFQKAEMDNTWNKLDFE